MKSSENLVDAMNAFGMKAMLDQVAAKPTENHAFSPISLGGALSILMQGASGSTADRFALSFGVNAGHAALAAGWRCMTDAMKKSEKSRKLSCILSSGLWHRNGLDLSGDARQRLCEEMEARISNLDFSDPAAASMINDWAKAVTNGMIPSLFQHLSPSTDMVLASAMAFKGAWGTPFQASLTGNQPFRNADGTVASVPTMRRLDKRFEHRKDRTSQAILLPYADPDYGLILALPNEAVTTVGLMTDTDWASPYGFETRDGEVHLPKLNINARYDLLDATTCPVVARTLAGPMDLSAYGDDWRGQAQIISQAVQSVALRWDEEGTEAAAVTAFGMTRSCVMSREEPFVLRFDRPFAFALLHVPSRAILIAGAVANLRG